MPKLTIKFTKYHFDRSKKSEEEQEGKHENENIKSLSLNTKYNKYLLGNSRNKKDKKDKKVKKVINNDDDEINSEVLNPDRITVIDSVNMRNSLISEVKSYYCKYLKRNISTPCSRTQATFTKYKNKLYLFGGLISQEENELWILESKNKRYFWQKIIYEKETHITLNLRYGHSCVYFNNNLYIFGGNINLKKLRNTLEDILIFNIKTSSLKIGAFKQEPASLTNRILYIPQRRNHIAHVIGWNMVVHGGIDINKEYLKENVTFSPNIEYNRTNSDNNNNVIKNTEASYILNDWMMLDLINLKWSQMGNILYKLRDKKEMKTAKFKRGIYRVYHSSCLVLSFDNIMKGNKINIYRNNNNMRYDIVEKEDDNDEIAYDLEKEGKYKFDIKYEGIYIFGGLDENLKETNNLFILHCFRNPLIFFEPQIKGIPPEKRSMASINFNKNLNIITLFGGKDVYRVFNDLFVLDIINFEWINIKLFGPDEICKKMGHCSEIINDNLLIFGGCDENNKYPTAKILCIELDILKNRNTSRIFEFAKNSVEQRPKDIEGKLILRALKEGKEIPKNLYNFFYLQG